MTLQIPAGFLPSMVSWGHGFVVVEVLWVPQRHLGKCEAGLLTTSLSWLGKVLHGCCRVAVRPLAFKNVFNLRGTKGRGALDALPFELTVPSIYYKFHQEI